MNWDYVAGFFDGEGCIIHRPPRTFNISLAQKEKEVLKSIGDFLNYNNIEYSLLPRKGKNVNGQNELRIYKQAHSLKFLESIIDKVIVKKVQVVNAINIIKRNTIIERHKPSRGLKMAIITMRDNGSTYREIDDILSCSLGVIYRALKEAGKCSSPTI